MVFKLSSWLNILAVAVNCLTRALLDMRYLSPDKNRIDQGLLFTFKKFLNRDIWSVVADTLGWVINKACNYTLA